MLPLLLAAALAAPPDLDATDYPASPYLSAADLPVTLAIETSYQAFNDHYYFALVDARVWYKPRFKRPIGEPDFEIAYDWRPFGHKGGLPYRVDLRKPENHDQSYVDGTREDFVPSLAFVHATEADALRLLPLDAWKSASEGELPLRDDFPPAERIVAITADDDELAVLTDARRMYYRRKYANLFVSSEWMPGWGQDKSLPVYFPAHLTDHKGWSLGRITAAAAGYKEGPDGRVFEWGPAAVSMETMVWLDPSGRKIWYLDSGTPPVVEHFIEAPNRGQWRGEGINAAASTVMVIDRFGVVQTKIADFDLLGSTPTHPYCYNDQCDDEPYYPPGDIRSGMSDIRLPSEGWRVHTPVRPSDAWDEDTWLTSHVTLLQTGRGNAQRELRVVGSEDGVLGYFHKGMLDEAWHFRAAPPGDRAFEQIAREGRLQVADLALHGPDTDQAALHASEPSLDRALHGRAELARNASIDLRMDNVNPEASPWRVWARVGDVEVPFTLHLVQAWNPYMPPAPADPSREVVTYEGTVDVDLRAVHEILGARAGTPEGKAVRAFLIAAKDRKFALLVDHSVEGVAIDAKQRRRTGRFDAVLRPLDVQVAPDTRAARSDWEGAHAGQMGWVEAAECATADALRDEMQAAVRDTRRIHRKARRFSRFTFATSGVMYVLQIKTLDAALDNRRAWRSADVRPNELRFNVITGITTRIPYLARHHARHEGSRVPLLKDERREALARLDALGCD